MKWQKAKIRDSNVQLLS